jgi:hypothetical protein
LYSSRKSTRALTTVAVLLVFLAAISIIASIYLVISASPKQQTVIVQTRTSSLGISFSLSVNSTTLRNGNAISVTLIIRNILSKTNNLSSDYNWSSPVLLDFGASTLQCPSWDNFVILNGYYSASSLFSAGKPLFLWPVTHSCPAFNLRQLEIRPSSTNATVYAEMAGNSSVYESDLAYESTLRGFYTSQEPCACSNTTSPSLTNFPDGAYTIVAGDEWGQMLILHFSVVSP